MQGGRKILQCSCFTWLLLPQNYSLVRRTKEQINSLSNKIFPRLHIVLKMGTEDF